MFRFWALFLCLEVASLWFVALSEHTDDNSGKSGDDSVPLSSGAQSAAEDFADDFFNTDPNGYRSYRDVKTKFWFVDRLDFAIEEASYSTPQLSPSKRVYRIPFHGYTSVLLSLRNLGPHTFNVNSVSGYLHAVHSFDFFVTNYTKRAVSSQLSPHSEMTIEYRFQPWEGLSPVDYVFSADVEYTLQSDTDKYDYRTKFVNATINVYDPSHTFDFELLFMCFLIAGVLVAAAAAVYVFYYVPREQSKGNQPPTPMELVEWAVDWVKPVVKAATEPVATEERVAIKKQKEQNDWIVGTAASSKRSRSKGKQSRKKKAQ